MKVEVVKARKALGFTAHMKLMNLGLKHIGASAEDARALKKAERELELYKKPGFYKDRRIKIVGAVPRRPRSEIIYVSFNGTGYKIKSGRNFIHTPITSYGNLRYACVDLEHLITEEEGISVLDDLVSLNNGVVA